MRIRDDRGLGQVPLIDLPWHVVLTNNAVRPERRRCHAPRCYTSIDTGAARYGAAMRLTITGARVFDGDRLLDGSYDVTIDGSILAEVEPSSDTPTAGPTVDGRGATLLPGLIDAHVHLRGTEDLATLQQWGVTTALDMGTWPPSLIDTLRATDSTDVRSTGAGAVGPGSPHARIPGRPADSIVTDPDAGRRFVTARLAEGMDYIKIIIDRPGDGGLDQPTINAIVDAARAAGTAVVAHAADVGAVAAAQAAGVDVLTHAPLDADLDERAVAEVLRADRTVVPTLVMMAGVAANPPAPGLDYHHARTSVTALHRAGVAVVLGTDANQTPGVPANVAYGESVHRELELLVEAGLTATEALRAATALPARRFALPDRGRVVPGLRADLLLVDGDPTTNITATRAIRGVRIAGNTDH